MAGMILINGRGDFNQININPIKGIGVCQVITLEAKKSLLLGLMFYLF